MVGFGVAQGGLDVGLAIRVCVEPSGACHNQHLIFGARTPSVRELSGVDGLMSTSQHLPLRTTQENLKTRLWMSLFDAPAMWLLYTAVEHSGLVPLRPMGRLLMYQVGYFVWLPWKILRYRRTKII